MIVDVGGKPGETQAEFIARYVAAQEAAQAEVARRLRGRWRVGARRLPKKRQQDVRKTS
jgi:hypothetical protein